MNLIDVTKINLSEFFVQNNCTIAIPSSRKFCSNSFTSCIFYITQQLLRFSIRSKKRNVPLYTSYTSYDTPAKPSNKITWRNARCNFREIDTERYWTSVESYRAKLNSTTNAPPEVEEKRRGRKEQVSARGAGKRVARRRNDTERPLQPSRIYRREQEAELAQAALLYP